jgi:Sulfotransferase family
MTGPIVVIGRPRSGSRVVCRLLQDNGVFMGADLYPEFLDSMSWYQRFVVPLVTEVGFPEQAMATPSPAWVIDAHARLADVLPRYWGALGAASPWGWKYCETLFVAPIIKRLFPGARFIHIVRNARAVCLSNHGYFQLTQGGAPLDWRPAGNSQGYPSFRDFCSLVAFGRTDVREWSGIDLSSPVALMENRFRLQAQSWITCVERARAYGLTLADDYHELRFEDLCEDPVEVSRRLFAWLDLPLRRPAELSAARAQSWRSARLSVRERRDLDRATDLAAPLLSALDYPG